MSLKLPTHYTLYNGGLWLEWTDGKVTTLDLVTNGETSKLIKGIEVHSFAFSNPIWNKPFARWDCINGFNQANRQYSGETGRFT